MRHFPGLIHVTTAIPGHVFRSYVEQSAVMRRARRITDVASPDKGSGTESFQPVALHAT